MVGVEGSIGAANAAASACPTAQSGARCACVPCASVHTSGGRELRRVRVASRRVGLVDVLWHGFYQSPSRRPEQLQWPFECTSAMGEQQLRRKRPAGGGSVPESTGAATDDASAFSFARLASLAALILANPCARAATTAGLGVFLLFICRAQRSRALKFCICRTLANQHMNARKRHG